MYRVIERKLLAYHKIFLVGAFDKFESDCFIWFLICSGDPLSYHMGFVLNSQISPFRLKLIVTNCITTYSYFGWKTGCLGRMSSFKKNNQTHDKLLQMLLHDKLIIKIFPYCNKFKERKSSFLHMKNLSLSLVILKYLSQYIEDTFLSLYSFIDLIREKKGHFIYNERERKKNILRIDR